MEVTMTLWLSLLSAILFPFLAMAQFSQEITINGQETELITLEKTVDVAIPVPYQVPSTCYRAEPYQSWECNNERRYRQECQWIPESQRCWTEHDRVCQPVTRYRQECTSIPTREICVERPSRQECRTGNDGQERCVTVGGGQSCQTVGGGQTCRDVAYTDQQCSSVPRNRCESVPGRNDCRDVPYYQEVCGNVTRYNQVPYACMETRYRDRIDVKKVSAEIELKIKSNQLTEEFPLKVSIKPKNARHQVYELEVALVKEPKVLVVLVSREIVLTAETDKEITLKGLVELELVDRERGTVTLPVEISEAMAHDSTGVLRLVFAGGLPKSGEAELTITHKPLLQSVKTFDTYKGAFPGNRMKITEVQGRAAIELKYAARKRFPARNFRVELKLKTSLDVAGEILNADRPETIEKTFSSFITVFR
jgi:hypothetical protein